MGQQCSACLCIPHRVQPHQVTVLRQVISPVLNENARKRLTLSYDNCTEQLKEIMDAEQIAEVFKSVDNKAPAAPAGEPAVDEKALEEEYKEVLGENGASSPKSGDKAADGPVPPEEANGTEK